MVDRVSALPDDILVSLVSRLPLKEAVATSVLSRRWQNVGLSTMNLRFDAVDGSTDNNFRHYPWKLKEAIEYWKRWKYIDWVNRVVQQYRGKHIEEFRISLPLDSRFSSSINEWIQFAMEKSVERLELDFDLAVSTRFEDYTFPHKLLGICFPSLGCCGYNIGFKSLKVLQIRHVGVTGEVLEYFLSNCPLLERLSVTCAKGLVNLRVVGSSIALKYLVIQNCHNLESIEIRDVNIVSFIYCGYRSTNISNVPLLSEVTVSNRCCPKDFIRVVLNQLSCCLSNIEILKLHLQLGAGHNENPVLPLFANLKHLELLVVANYYKALHHLNSFLKASPYLQRLVLKLQLYSERACMGMGEIEKAADCPHNHLKVVEIVGYRAHKSGVELVMHLIKNGLGLEKIVIDPVRTWRHPNGADKPHTELDEEVKARDHAKQYLEAKMPSTVEFVCL
ncbi:putative F-box domain, FBD domain, leucine-rich repeat domain, L domain-containing protein [Rosa chinensis]|uniref:Putative F-box domain, FBD domain, leucine-rich repeat domain, L domain-containing protein n=1 Tax=Rosa chinensis TaxID=74649 RepID=A0A2P6R5L7_ROSCH|nr:putative F-box domain, FBD domain, leucine-rich repeat domain, L domain-containing protein [Rosa chinensis]